MARTIQVTPEALNTAAGKIESLAADYKTQYDLLYSKTDAMASTYQGKDYETFINQISGFKDDFEKMRALMTAYADFLRKSAKAYAETQNNITDYARKLKN